MSLIPPIQSPHDDSQRNILNLMREAINKFDGKQLLEKTYNLFNKNAVVEGSLSNGNVVDNSNFVTSDFMPVEGGKYLQVKPTAGSTAVYDENFNYITGFSNSDSWPIILPNNARYVRTSMLKSSVDTKYVYLGLEDKPFVEYGFKYSDSVYDAEFIRELQEILEVAQQIVIDNSEVDEYVNMFDKSNVMMDKSVSQGQIIDSPGFYAYEINVLPGKDLMITPTVGASSFMDANGEYISGLTSLSTVPVKVPPRAYKLITSGYRNSLETKMVYYGTEVIDYKEFGEGAGSGAGAMSNLSNRLSFNSDGAPVVSVPYDNEGNLEIEFGRLGVNNIHHMTNIKTKHFTHRVTSDFIAPYRVRAVNNPVASNDPFTTGGNHGTDGGTGYATARAVSIDAFVDNVKQTEGVHGTERAIVVKVVNAVCGYNTINRETGQSRRDVLREHITYRITRNNVEVSLAIEALEPIVLERWRGLQWQNGPWAERAYVPTDSKGIAVVTSDLSFTAAGERLISFNDAGDAIGMYINPDVGIGDFKHNTSQDKFFFSGAKAYSRLMTDTANVSMAAGDVLEFAGGYYFGRFLESPGLANAYNIMRNGKRLYCIDDFWLREGFMKLLPEDDNKEIKEVKRVGYTATPRFTSTLGLRISKPSGAGTLSFEVI